MVKLDSPKTCKTCGGYGEFLDPVTDGDDPNAYLEMLICEHCDGTGVEPPPKEDKNE